MTKVEACRLGGLATKAKYGMEHYREIGAKGGRPELPTLAELLTKEASIVKLYRWSAK